MRPLFSEDKQLKLYAVSCEVFERECSRAAAYSPHIAHVSFMSFGLHNTPDELRKTVQAEIDKASGGGFDYILLAYGLCSRGTADLVARDTPIVIPRAHDCITLLLGSKERYQREFSEHPGTYYYSAGWIERKAGDINQGIMRDSEEQLREYIEKYGEDNARYLLEQESLWYANYDRAALIDTGLGDADYYRKFARDVADAKGWSYAEMSGDLRLIDSLFGGNWDPSEFLIVQPGQKTFEDVNAGIIGAG